MSAILLAALPSVLAALLPLLTHWLKNRFSDDPLQQHRNRVAQAEQDVAGGAPLPAAEHGAADLAELDRLQRAKGAQQ